MYRLPRRVKDLRKVSAAWGPFVCYWRINGNAFNIAGMPRLDGINIAALGERAAF